MDPLGRTLLEKCYEAILDAGINPVELKNTKTGVLIGCLYSDTELYWLKNLGRKPMLKGYFFYILLKYVK